MLSFCLKTVFKILGFVFFLILPLYAFLSLPVYLKARYVNFSIDYIHKLNNMSDIYFLHPMTFGRKEYSAEIKGDLLKDFLTLRSSGLYLAGHYEHFDTHQGEFPIEIRPPYKSNLSIEGYLVNNVSKHLLAMTTLHLDPSQKKPLSVQKFLKEEVHHSFLYNFDEKGFRHTVVPEGVSFDAETKDLLIVGDSVAMGYNLSDEESIASHLQFKVGSKYKISNAAVTGFDSSQIFRTLKRELKSNRYDVIIYMMCENDIKESFTQEFNEILSNLEKLVPRETKIVFIFNTFLDFSLEYENPQRKLESRKSFNGLLFNSKLVKTISKSGRIHAFIDSREEFLKNAVLQRHKTKYMDLYFYNDNIHFSNKGSEIIAEKIQEFL